MHMIKWHENHLQTGLGFSKRDAYISIFFVNSKIYDHTYTRIHIDMVCKWKMRFMLCLRVSNDV